MYYDTGKTNKLLLLSTNPDAFDSSPGDLLTVIKLNALQTMAALQVLEGHVSDEGAVVQLQHREALLAAGTAAQGSDAVVCDQLAVGQGLPGAGETRLKKYKICKFNDACTRIQA